MGLNIVIAVTDGDWFDLLRKQPNLGEVNFWAPSAANFRALQPGELFLFKLHAPRNFVVGGGSPPSSSDHRSGGGRTDDAGADGRPQQLGRSAGRGSGNPPPRSGKRCRQACARGRRAAAWLRSPPSSTAVHSGGSCARRSKHQSPKVRATFLQTFSLPRFSKSRRRTTSLISASSLAIRSLATRRTTFEILS